MATDYIEWLDIKDPHPSALENIQTAVDHMMKIGATSKFSPISIYALAKQLGKQQKQMTQLLRDRPGFIRVEYNGKSRGCYYDYKNFGVKYPAIYGLLRTKHDLLSVEDLEATVVEEAKNNVREINEQLPAMAKQLQAAKVDYTIPGIEGLDSETLTVKFPVVLKESLAPGPVKAELNRALDAGTIHEDLVMILMNIIYWNTRGKNNG